MDKVIFWDFDGTLVKPNTRFVNSLHSSLDEFGLIVTNDLVSTHLKKVFPWLNYDITYPDSTQNWWDDFLKKLIPFYQIIGVEQSIFDKINLSFKTKITTINDYVIYDDTLSTLKQAKARGYKNYLLSNNFPELPFFLDEFGLTEYFSGLIVSSHVGYEKPRKELFDYAKRLANCTSGIMVGDNPVADILGAKNAGLKTALVHNQSPSEADYTFDSLKQILDILD